MDPTDTSKWPVGDFDGNDAAKRIKPNESPFTERGRGRGGGFGRGHMRGSSSANGRGIGRGFRGGFVPRGGRGFVRGGGFCHERGRGFNQGGAGIPRGGRGLSRGGRGFVRGGGFCHERGRGFNQGGAGITRGGRGFSRGGRGAPRGVAKRTSDTKEGKMKISRETSRELLKLNGRQLKGIKLEREIEQRSEQTSEEDFPGYPGWSQASLIGLLRKFSTSLNHNTEIWDKVEYPGRTSQECRRVWQKFEQDVQLSMRESLSCVKVMLMETVPNRLKPEIVFYKHPWQIYAEREKDHGRSIGMKGKIAEQMFHSLEETVKAEYELQSVCRWKGIHTNVFDFCKNYPESLGSFSLGRSIHKYS